MRYGYEDYDVYDKDGYNKYGFDKDGYDRNGNYIANMFGNEPYDELVPEEDTITTPSKFTTSTATQAAQDKVKETQNAVNSKGKYTYADQKRLTDLIDKILTRPAFSYDFNSDAIYQQYRDKYIKQGKMAMADTMGQAAAMTGGYGNSYATSAGYQAYQASLENLNDIIPELYAMELERYKVEGQALTDQYAVLADDKNTDYGMWVDDYNRLLSQLEYYTGVADTSWARDYGAYRDEVGDAQWQTEQRRIAAQNSIANAQWEKEYERLLANDVKAAEQWDYMVSQDDINRTENNAKTYYETGGKIGYDNGSVSTENIKKMQEALGVSPDGKWGSGSTEAAGGLTADQAWKAYQDGTLGEPNLTYEEVKDELKYYIIKGASQSEIDGYLSEVIKYMAPEEYNKLKELYTTRDQIYGPSLPLR